MSENGSYKINDFKNASNELERLSIQADLMKPLEKKILTESGLKPHHKVLEVGCGPGFVTSLLCEMAQAGQVIATDTDEKLLSLCRKRILNPPKGGFSALNTHGRSLELPEDSIDFSYLRFVLQHVPQTKELIADVFKCLTDGGTICALDSDDGLVLQHPEDALVNEILNQAQKKQSSKGGDRFMGRKIPLLFQKSGFVEIQSRVLSFTSSDIPFTILAKVLFGFKSELTGRQHDLETWIEQTEPKIKKGEYFLSAGVIITTAKKMMIKA